jgi:hypothetical protein
VAQHSTRSPAYQRVAITDGSGVGWQARIVAKPGWIASCHEIGMEWVQVAAKRDGIAASVHLHTVAGAREDLEWAKLVSATAVVPRTSKAVKYRPSLLSKHRGTCGFGTKPVLDIGLG